MSKVTCQISMSLDGYVAGPHQSTEDPLGIGGERLHTWLDELYLHIAPIMLGGGERLFVDVGDPTFEPVEVIHSPAATHVRYRVVR